MCSSDLTRLAILDRGRVVADGTPRDLLETLPGRTLLVETPDPREAQRLLRDQPGIVAIAQIGNSLRVLASGGAEMDRRIAERLHGAGQPAHVAPIAPNLEDVFVVATKNGMEAKHAAS